MKKIAVIIYGPPGSGKSTQAELVANHFGLIRFDTGKYIAAEIYDPKNKRNKTVQRQKMLYEKGLLCERPWVYRIVSNQLRRIIAAGYGVVLGGSPRDAYEAFDAPKRPGVYSILARGYGKENIFTFILDVRPEHSVNRNVGRKLCPVCRRAYIMLKGCVLSECPFCGARLQARKDDREKIVMDRLVEYRKQTEPIYEGLRRLGYRLNRVDGEQLPHKVFEGILKKIPS